MERKVKGGVSINSFKDFIMRDNHQAISVDPVPVSSLNIFECDLLKGLEELIKEEMIQKRTYRELIFVG